MTSLTPVRQQPAGGRLEDYAAIVTDEIIAALLEPARQSGLRQRGKILAQSIETEFQFEAAPHPDHDISTAALIRYRTARGRPA
jgi:hypothetical protein